MKLPEQPRFHIRLQDDRSIFTGGETLSCEYRIDLPNQVHIANDQQENSTNTKKQSTVAAIETSVLWQTEGKGDEDIGVHFFERREKKLAQPQILKQLHRLNTVLPHSPLSYSGTIVKVNWFIRVRIFLQDGTSYTDNRPFKLVARQTA